MLNNQQLGKWSDNLSKTFIIERDVNYFQTEIVSKNSLKSLKKILSLKQYYSNISCESLQEY